MLKNSIQHYLYHKYQEREQLIKTLKILRLPIHICWILSVIEVLRKVYFPNSEIGTGFLFWAFVVMLIFYWMPNKKEYVEWKKNHSTF